MKRRRPRTKKKFKPAHPSGPMTGRRLADILGVAPMTVSLVMSGKPGPSEETRRRVLAAAHKHDYRPNLAARIFRSGSYQTVTPIVPLLCPPGDKLDPRAFKAVLAIQGKRRLCALMVVMDPETVMATLRPYSPELVVNLTEYDFAEDMFSQVITNCAGLTAEAVAEQITHRLK